MKVAAKGWVVILPLVALLLLGGAGNSFAQEKMTMDEYNAQLQQLKDREAAANQEIQNCDTRIAQLQSDISDAENQTNQTWADIYRTIGATEAEVNAFRNELNQLDNQLNALAALSPEELFKRRKELDAIDERLMEMKQSRIAALTEMRNKIASMEGKIVQLRSKMPRGLWDEYTVARGDYLWRIAGKPDIYGDSMQWIRIYSYNTEQITDPDLIYPDQIFKIHKENSDDEYLVSRGDNLYKISGNMEVLGDPTKWRQLYDANQTAIGDDPSLIYPYQVLKIPR
ncbi:LysM peptidoglycan-binding domain-containing protein [bacterium]|nr:LysM peptidoglycan-binding domain-containing protein [bacterium]